MDDSFAATMANADDAFKADAEQQVKLVADVEDRFYATLSSEYASGHPRPEYLLTVRLGSFDATVEGRSEESKASKASKASKDSKDSKESAPWIGEVRCSAAVTLQRRQQDGPALLVCHGKAESRVGFRWPDRDKSAGTAIAVNAAAGGGSVRVPSEQVLQAIESALRKSLRPMIPSMDRELMLRASERKAETTK